MINLNELSAVPILTVGGYNVWGSWRGSSPLKYDNEEEKERGRAAFLPPLMTHRRCSPHVSNHHHHHHRRRLPLSLLLSPESWSVLQNISMDVILSKVKDKNVRKRNKWAVWVNIVHTACRAPVRTRALGQGYSEAYQPWHCTDSFNTSTCTHSVHSDWNKFQPH